MPSNDFKVIEGGASDTGHSNSVKNSHFSKGGGGPTVDAETKRYVDSEGRAMRADTDKKYTEVSLNLKALSEKIDALPRPLGFWQIAGMGATGVIALVTIFGVMADRFDGGISAFGIIDRAVEIQQLKDAEQDERLNRLISVLEVQNAKVEESPEIQD